MPTITKYTYSISQDTLNGVVSLDSLTSEIQESTITISLDHIDTNGDVLDIYFKDALSVDDKTTLDTVVSSHAGIPLPQNAIQDVNISTQSTSVAMKREDLVDLSGKSYYKYPDQLNIDTSLGTNCFLLSWASYTYIQGGGYWIPYRYFDTDVEKFNRPDYRDRLHVDIVDIDNVIGMGKSYVISKVARSNNVVTLTTTIDHTFAVGDKIHVDAVDDTFDKMEIEIVSVPSPTTITYNQIGNDIAEKEDSGKVGLIVVLHTFVYGDFVSPEAKWTMRSEDGKLIPPGIFVRFKLVPSGNSTNNYFINLWTDMRTYPV